jgi:hypothetical protein
MKAFREALKAFLGLSKDLPVYTRQDTKEMSRQKVDAPNQNTQSYPSAYLTISEIGIRKDQEALKALTRNSSGHMPIHATQATLPKAYMFPAFVSAVLHIKTRDFSDAVTMATKCLICASSGKLNCKIHMNGVEWFVTIVCETESIPIDPPEIDSTSNPDIFHLEISFTVNSRLGTVKEVPKTNGTVTQTIMPRDHAQL